MAYDHFKLIFRLSTLVFPICWCLIIQRLAAIRHRWTYKATQTPKNVVVIGGSFAGIELVHRLAESLPTGYKVVLVEKNSHFNYLFNFPRFSVLQGYERLAFIPYDTLVCRAPKGIYERIHDEALCVTDGKVELSSGGDIPFEYLIIATGSTQPSPSKLLSTESEEACKELQAVQNKISAAGRIAVVGAGAVGVELASDIKDFYPGKHVTLIHSRSRLLNQFGQRLHDYALSALEKLGVDILLNERPHLPDGQTLVFSDGHTETFDLIIPCTGQRSNSSILSTRYPEAISKETARILVKSNLQISVPDISSPPIFALGDVAEHGGPKMARAGFFQAQVVADNVVSMIQNREPSSVYRPEIFIEGAIKLTLGKKHVVMYAMDADGSDVLLPSHKGSLDLDIKWGWRRLGAAKAFPVQVGNQSMART